MASSYCMSSAPPSVYSDRWAFHIPLRESPTLQWRVNNLSLDRLHDLAMSLNTGDVELTPIQAWTELSNRYTVETLLAPGTLEGLAREFQETLNCVIFGAAVERQVFESIIRRVLPPVDNNVREIPFLE